MSDEIRRALDQDPQQLERELAQLDRLSTPPQPPLSHVEREVVEVITVSRLSGHIDRII
jgi:hypothetical protein